MKLKKQKHIIFLVFISLISLAASLLFSPIVSAKITLRAFADDTIASYPTILKTSIAAPNTNIVFRVKKPDGSFLEIPAKTSASGIAQADFFGFHTKKAGVYKLTVFYPYEKKTGTESTFEVFPSRVSASQSNIILSKETIPIGNKNLSYLSVILKDKYLNPVPNHQIKIISSRAHDKIIPMSSATDKNGEINYKISSKYEGVSVFSAIDLTSNITIDSRAKAYFYLEPKNKSFVGGSLAKTFLAQITGNEEPTQNFINGPVDHFEITGIPDNIETGSEEYLTIIARDKNNNTAKDYTGNILISTTDDRAVLPNNGEYIFKAEDQGERKFDLAIIFKTLGKQTITIVDMDDFKIQGEKDINIIEPSSVIQNTTSGSNVRIKSPQDSMEFGSPQINITGQAVPNTNLIIFDNNKKIGKTEVDTEGFFSFTAKNLHDGTHVFYAMEDKDSNPSVSNKVEISVDITPPSLDSIEIVPDGPLKPNTVFNITITSEPNLDITKARIGNILEPLTAKQGKSGVYEALLSAPSQPLEYPISIILADNLGNKEEYLNQAVLKVIPAKISVPPKIEKLSAHAKNSAVDLIWASPINYEKEIKNYKVYFGTGRINLAQYLNTEDSNTSITVTNLINSQEYFFAVTAIDENGNESIEKSIVVSAIPEKPKISLYAAPSDRKITLTWDVFSSVPPATYKIQYGISSGNYIETNIINGTNTNFVVDNLINDVTYFFKVKALDYNNKEIAETTEASATPFANLSSYYPSPPPLNSIPEYNTYPAYNPSMPNSQTGPEIWWIIISSVVFLELVFIIKKKYLNKHK